MNILMVLAGEVDLNIEEFIKENNIEYIVAVDGGYNHLNNENIKPNILIGDFDSIDNFEETNIISLDEKKDNTDYEHALNYIDENLNYEKIFVIGFLSLKRPEHFYANLKNISEKMEYISSETSIKLFLPGTYEVNKTKYVSFFAHEKVENLNLEGFEYKLEDYDLNVNDTLCISNEVKESGKVSFKKGKLIVFFSK